MAQGNLGIWKDLMDQLKDPALQVIPGQKAPLTWVDTVDGLYSIDVWKITKLDVVSFCRYSLRHYLRVMVPSGKREMNLVPVTVCLGLQFFEYSELMRTAIFAEIEKCRSHDKNDDVSRQFTQWTEEVAAMDMNNVEIVEKLPAGIARKFAAILVALDVKKQAIGWSFYWSMLFRYSVATSVSVNREEFDKLMREWCDVSSDYPRCGIEIAKSLQFLMEPGSIYAKTIVVSTLLSKKVPDIPAVPLRDFAYMNNFEHNGMTVLYMMEKAAIALHETNLNDMFRKLHGPQTGFGINHLTKILNTQLKGDLKEEGFWPWARVIDHRYFLDFANPAIKSLSYFLMQIVIETSGEQSLDRREFGRKVSDSQKASLTELAKKVVRNYK